MHATSEPGAAKRAAAMSDRRGSPRIAAVEPISTARLLTSITSPRFEKSWTGLAHGPTTKPDDDELSARL